MSWNADSAKAGSARLLRFCRVVLLTLLFTNVMTAARADTNSDAGRDIGGDAEVVRITVLGDSLVAGYGLPPGTSFPDALDSALVAAGFKVEVVNAGVSGDTTAGGLARLDWSLADDPDMVIIVMGGNDMLRGLDPAATRANLDAMITRLHAQGVALDARTSLGWQPSRSSSGGGTLASRRLHTIRTHNAIKQGRASIE